LVPSSEVHFPRALQAARLARLRSDRLPQRRRRLHPAKKIPGSAIQLIASIRFSAAQLTRIDRGCRESRDRISLDAVEPRIVDERALIGNRWLPDGENEDAAHRRLVAAAR
jgi:hypothetical protein